MSTNSADCTQLVLCLHEVAVRRGAQVTLRVVDNATRLIAIERDGELVCIACNVALEERGPFTTVAGRRVDDGMPPNLFYLFCTACSLTSAGTTLARKLIGLIPVQPSGPRS